MAVTAIQTRATEFRDALEKHVLVADGAMGTVLYAKGVFINRCYDELNLSLPALVRDVHQEYVKAGAEILETNTFGANRKRLGAFGFAEKVRLINQAGVRIAREAAREQAFVAGAVGPLGIRLEPLGPTSFEEARAIFREQIDALVEAGVDLLVLETFRDINELREAIFAARESAGADMMIMAQLSIEDDGTLRDGTSTDDFTLPLDEWPVDVIGLNCSSGPKVMLETIEKMAGYTNKPLSAMPNAGLPGDRGRPQPVSLLAGIYGAICAAVPAGGREDRRRLLRHHAGAHQGNPQRSAQPAARPALARRYVGAPPSTRPKALEKVAGPRKERAGREAGRRTVRGFRRDSSAARRRRVQGDRRREALQSGRDRLHQCSGRAARQRAHERPGHLPADPAAGRNRSGASFLLPRPEYSEHSERAARRLHCRACAI